MNLKQFKQKAALVRNTATKFTDSFNELTKDAVRIVWNPEIGDVSPVNICIELSMHLKGIDRRALVTFFKECVPHTFDSDSGLFKKKNPKTVDRLRGEWEQFITDHNWYDYSKVSEAKAYEFNVEKVAAYVAAQIKKARDHNQFSVEKLDMLALALDETIQRNLEGLIDEPEMVEEALITELRAVG